ncbi:ABC transporter ATP-binding protein [Ollibium composti]|uniref:ABC transporter ATP-binding protein n=1 Tax=Ollibium composti TaxID=2675109 RepID=A0ABY2Q2Y5_9HYPH|nr:ABC transporter ATP-binding protein [Mesorhizobium composti]THF55313.1 ABC transporter ATP-binding protein [Mesorhizobium composti]
MTLLSVAHLSAALGGRPVLHDISFAVGPGELVGLIGPNGAGKSTLLRAVMGLTPATGGIVLDGEDGRVLTAARRALKVAFVAQNRDVAWAMSVEALVALGRLPHLPRLSPLRAADRAAVDAAMRMMDIEAYRERQATALSGGELARVLAARALAQETPLLLADEPAAGLDPAHQISLMRTFRSLAEQGRSVVVSTHDLALAARSCTRLILLDRGRVVADGTPEAVVTADNLQSVYRVRAYFGEVEGRMIVLPLDLSERT